MVLLLAAVGTVGCIAGIVGIWTVHHRTSERVQRIFGGVEVGFQRTTTATQKVRRAVGTARTDLDQVRTEAAALGDEERRRDLRRFVRQRVDPHLDELSGRLAALSDAAAAVAALQEIVRELAGDRPGQLDPEQLDRWAEEARQLSAAVRRLDATIDEDEGDGGRLAAAASEVDRVLQRCEARVDDWQSALDAARDDVRQVEADLLRWLTAAAVVATFLGVWVGAGQVSLFVHALSWCRGARIVGK